MHLILRSYLEDTPRPHPSAGPAQFSWNLTKLILPCLPGTHLSSSSRSYSRYYSNDISIRSLLCSTATSSQITYQDCFLCNVEHCPCCAAALCGHNLCPVACSLCRVELEWESCCCYHDSGELHTCRPIHPMSSFHITSGFVTLCDLAPTFSTDSSLAIQYFIEDWIENQEDSHEWKHSKRK